MNEIHLDYEPHFRRCKPQGPQIN